MSHMYDIEIEVQTLKNVEMKQAVLAELYIPDASDDYGPGSNEEPNVLRIDGTVTLHGGESEKEAHERLEKVVKDTDPKARVVSRWRDAERPFDDEFGSLEEISLEEEN